MKRPTLDKILKDLETAKQMAIDDRHITGIITASMAQAKLLGFDKGIDEPNSDNEININIIRVGKKTIDPKEPLLQ